MQPDGRPLAAGSARNGFAMLPLLLRLVPEPEHDMHTLDQALRDATRIAVPFGPIVMAPGRGRGPTALAAFDAALLDAGVANYNLICLSSVIPPGSTIERRRWRTPAHEWGQRLYCVLSQAREDRPGHEVHAGIGWVRDECAGHGLFVELHDADRTRLEHDLRATLGSMQRQRGLALGAVHTEIAGARCEGEPVCALVIAVYASAPW